MYQPIFISGASGAGKSSSLRNLDPEATIIINTERKQLPFRGAGKFKRQAMIKDFNGYQRAMEKSSACDDAEIVVVDSFTSLSEHALQHAQAQWRGFDVWSGYAKLIYDLIQYSKEINKYVVFIGIDEPLQDGDGSITRHIRVDGKAMKGSIEKEFTCVLWAQVINEGGSVRHVFQTNNDGRTTAKTPMDMFPSVHIDNDLNAVIQAIKDYYA